MKVVISDAMSDAGAVAARSLHLAGFEVHGLDSRRLPRFMASRHLSGYKTLGGDDPVAREEAVLEFVDRVKADVFLPLFTHAAVTAVRRRLDFAALCRTATPPPEAFLAAYDKRLCMQSCSALGIPCAGSLSNDDAAARLSQGGDQAVIVKPAFDVSGALGLRRVTTIEDLDAAIRACETLYGSCVIQEYIPGDDDSLRMVTVVYGDSGRLIGGFSARKLRQHPRGGGVTASGISTRDAALLELVRPFFDAWRWRGPAEVELKHDARHGTYRLIEINPRFPGYLRHASRCGVELAECAVRAALGDEPPAAAGLLPYRAGVAYVAPVAFVTSVVQDARVRGWRTALAGAWHEARAAAPLLRDMLADPLPVVARSLVAGPSHRPVPLDRPLPASRRGLPGPGAAAGSPEAADRC